MSAPAIDIRDTRPASDRQVEYIRGLLETRDVSQLTSTIALDTITLLGGLYADTISDSMADSTIKALLAIRPVQVQAATTKSEPVEVPSWDAIRKMTRDLPDAYYALEAKDGSKHFFFQIKTGKDGRKRVYHVVGAPKTFRRKSMKMEWVYAAVKKITNDPKAAAQEFGKIFTRCAVCSAPLSDPESLARNMGPVCATRFC